LQVEALWDTCFTDADIREALANLPKDLEETYRRCVERIGNRNRYAPKVLRWVGYASCPLHIDELREAVAFDLQDRAWSADKLPNSASLISCCANLVVVDATDQRVRFAHSSVKQYLEQNRGSEIIAYPANPKQGELECGELCVSYLSFSDFGLQVEKNSHSKLPFKPPDLIANPALGTIGAVASKICGYIAPMPDPQSKSISIRMPRKSTPLPGRKQYKLLDYAVANWAMQTKMITRESTVWNRFQRLAMNFNESWNIHPWIRGGRSQRSHLHGLLGWAVKERHIPLLEIVLDLETRYGLNDICNLPVIGGSMPALHVASRLGFEDVVKLLLKICEVNTIDGEGYSALHHAADKGHLAVTMLLSNAKGVKVDIESNDKCTPLWLAIANGHEQIVYLLIQKRAKFKIRDKASGSTPLSWAAGNGHEAVVRLLLEKGFDANFKDFDSQTPLSRALWNGHEAVVKLLLENGADVDVMDYNGQTPLLWAVRNKHEALTKLLLDHGADVGSRDRANRTPLSLAAEKGYEAIVRLLLEHGADVDSKDSYRKTPLLLAAKNGHEAVVKLLLEKGADVGSKDGTSKTPLSWAASGGHETAVRLLLERGADVSSKDSNGRKPLLWAAGNGHEAIVRLLVEHGADVDSKDCYSQTPLSWAANNGHEAVVKLLLEKGADVNSKGSGNETPLWWATQKGHETVVKLLLYHGANADSKNNSGHTPLSLARMGGYEGVVKLLESKTQERQ
jgi:ankyrin repeat protein